MQFMNTSKCLRLQSRLKSALRHDFSRMLSSKSGKPITKILVANRGEIAIRIFRAAKEMGIKSLAVYSKEDSNQLFRQKADESRMLNPDLKPVDAYLSVEDIIRIAKANGVDAIHPGYGFLSERADFAEACEKNGITFIGPRPETVHNMGEKTAARQLAIDVGVPVVPGTDGAVSTAADARKQCEGIGFPVMLKAAYGGGGRGLRIVREAADLEKEFNTATSEAKAAFGDGSMFIEKYIENPRHIEVQILGDKEGNVVHLFERDCSVQRRHQKVVEIAPAPNLDDSIRQKITADAVKLCKSAGYENAGTVEFLLDQSGNYYFIEVNARLQVEHTVTEEITGIDLVHSQIQIAQGKSLKDLGITQDKITKTGNAIQCRITTEDPAADFRPDTGRLDAFQLAEGMGIRIDGASTFAGAVITPFYDSLMLKMTGKGSSHQQTCAKLNRALDEMVIKGVKTNIPFLKNVLSHPEFVEGAVNTGFIGTNPELFSFPSKENKTYKLVSYLADISVNGPSTQLGVPEAAPSKVRAIVPPTPADSKGRKGLRHVFVEQGPKAFADAVRKHPKLLVTDTTMRDAHQSLLATRVRTKDLAAIAPFTNHALKDAYSLEMWGGATFDVALRFLRECPWDRVHELRELIPDVPFQMLLRGANGVGYASYPDNVIYKFCKLAKDSGIDIFRIFDSLNYMPNLQLGIDAVNEAGGIVEGAISYTGDVSNPKKTKYNLDYYLRFAEELSKAGIHTLCIKDMAGLLKPEAARMLVGALRREHPDLPIHIHTHDTSGAAVSAMIEAAKAGADVVDVAVDSMSGLTSQPSMGALVASLQGTSADTGLDLNEISDLSTYWEMTRNYYAPFEATHTMKSGSADVYEHEIPGGQYTNLHFQAYALGLADKWPLIKKKYAEANRAVGDIIKVTPSSKFVGDLAQFMVQNDLDEKSVVSKAADLSFPTSVIDYFKGSMGIPTGGFPEPLRSNVLKGEKGISGRPGASMKPADFDKLKKELEEKHGVPMREVDVMSSVLYPQVFDEFVTFKQQYGPVTHLDTRHYLQSSDIDEEIDLDLPQGTTTVKKLSVGQIHPKTGERNVFYEINGQPRSVSIRDKLAAKSLNIKPKADPSVAGSVGAPMPGSVVGIKVKAGQKVEKGEPLLVLSAMKMETVVAAPCSGVIDDLCIKVGEEIAAGDLVINMST